MTGVCSQNTSSGEVVAEAGSGFPVLSYLVLRVPQKGYVEEPVSP